jgi:tRNA(His) guanylyltransferase
MINNMKLSLGDRIKQDFEDRTRYLLPRRAYHILRIDGRAFASYTRQCLKPFDQQFMHDMNETAKFLCAEVQGSKLAYVQSDEISIVFTDFDTPETHLMFNGNIQKIVSVTASLAGAKFNQLRPQGPLAAFDARVFSVPLREEVLNTLLWRQIDAMKNSVQMTARHYLGAKVIHGLNVDELKSELVKIGQPWENCPLGFQQGRIVLKESYLVPATTKETKKGLITVPEHQRTRWQVQDSFNFLDKDKFAKIIPAYP